MTAMYEPFNRRESRRARAGSLIRLLVQVVILGLGVAAVLVLFLAL